jgi:hypothetical protein
MYKHTQMQDIPEAARTHTEGRLMGSRKDGLDVKSLCSDHLMRPHSTQHMGAAATALDRKKGFEKGCLLCDAAARRERVEQVDFALGAFAFPQIALRLENRSLGQDFPVRALNGCKSAYRMRSALLRRLTL